MIVGSTHCLNNTHHCEADLGWEALHFHLTGNMTVRIQQSAFASREVKFGVIQRKCPLVVSRKALRFAGILALMVRA